MSVQAVTEADFEQEVLNEKLPVLIDFHADWCQPCKRMAPEVEALAQELAGKVKVVQIDIDQNPRIAQGLRIQSVPTFMVFAGARPVAMERGVVPRARLRELVEPFLPRAQGAVKPKELDLLIRERGAVAVDVREAAPYGRAHIPGAKNMPLEEIETRLAELHMLGLPVLYCRTGKEAQALSEKLAADEIGVAFLEGGFLGWEAEFLPIERG